MPGLITIEDIEVALGRALSDEAEEAKVHQRINQISAFVNGYVDCSFSIIEDDEIRVQADYYGLVDLGGDPISSVASISHYGESWMAGNPQWDGLRTIFGLYPLEVVDVVYTHGYSSVPEDVKGVVLDAVLQVVGLGNDEDESGPIRSFVVGDVTEAYAFSKEIDGATFINVSLSGGVLNRYCKTAGTYRLGGYGFPPYPRYGVNDWAGSNP